MSGTFVAIEGPTGVGKTTLAARLASTLDAEPIFDPFGANPFFAQLLAAGPSAGPELALRVELTFLALRIAQLRHIGSILATGTSVVADWALIKQPLFAATTLPPDDTVHVAAMCEVWSDNLPTPDLLIGLSATTAALRSRVRQRGRGIETAITAAHLAALSGAFDRAYAKWHRPLIRVDATTFDVFDERHLNELAAQVRQLPMPLES